LLAASTESHFRASGGCDLLGTRAAARANLDAKRTEVAMSGKLANLFEADVVCAASLDNPSWEFSAGFRNDFSTAFHNKVSDEILAWAKRVEQDFARANADLEKAMRDVTKMNSDIEMARAQVKKDRATNEAALRRAEADLNKISADIAKMQDQVKRERSQHLAGISRAQQDVDRITGQIAARRTAVNAQRAKDIAGVKTARDQAKTVLDAAETTFKKAVSAWQKAKGLDKIPKGLDKDAKGIDRDAKKLAYQAKAKAYEIANEGINKVPVDLDPQIVALSASQSTARAALSAAKDALKAIHGTAPIDADPRIAGLFVGRDTAKTAVKAAQSAFDLAHRAPVDADPRVASLFAARDAALVALDVAKAAVNSTNDAVQWGAKATAAAASGQLLHIESARLTCGLSVFQQGGKMELLVAVRVMNEAHNLRLAVDNSDLANGNVFRLAGNNLIPKQRQGN
jgi:hypothetical protein